MASFDNIPIEATAEDLENVASRPYLIQDRKPTGLDIGKEGQWWIYENTTTEQTRLFQRVNSRWVEYVPNDRTIAGIMLNEDISVKSLQQVLETYPPKFLATEPNEKTKGDINRFYLVRTDSKNTNLYFCGGLSEDTGNYLWFNVAKDVTSGSGGDIDLSGYVPTTRKIADVDLEDDITISELQTSLGIGDINTALDNIIAIQEALINGNYTKGITLVDEQTNKEYKLYVSNEKVTLEEVE